MKTRHFQILITIVLFLAGSALTASAQPAAVINQKIKGRKIMLFNKKDLNNWDFKLKDNFAEPSQVFTIQNKVIHITGTPFGYMRTKDQYSGYMLHVEYRWPAEATNSGIFIHSQVPDAIWPECVECQLAAGNAGDLICAGGADMNERTDKSKRVIKKMAESSEKPVGEWNTVEIVCKDNTIEVSVNGVLQNKGTGVSVNKGHICLQSEGKDIEFRNVYLRVPEK